MTEPNRLIKDKLIGTIPPVNYKKSHNKNFGIYNYAFLLHDYEYSLCKELWKKAIYTSLLDLEEQYKHDWAIQKYSADKNLKYNIKILSTYTEDYKDTSILEQFKGFIISELYYNYFYFFGNPKPYKLGNLL